MTQGENVNLYPWKKKSGRKQKKEKKENSQIKEWEKEKEGKKIPDQGSKENRGKVQKGRWTR